MNQERKALRAQDSAETVAPVGDGNYVVQPGEGLSAIAEAQGFFWLTLWNMPANTALRRARRNPETLVPGDRLTIPALREKTVPCETGRLHRFRRRGVPARLIFRVRSPSGRVFAGKDYELVVDGQRYKGMTDASGRIDHWVATRTKAAELTVFFAEGGYPKAVTWQVRLGHMFPADTMRGVQHRLRNLGFECGDEEGRLGPSTTTALREFQTQAGLPPSGELDEATRRAILDHGGA